MGKRTRRQARTPRWHKATALLPLVLLAGAVSANAATGDREQLSATRPTTGDPRMPTVPDTAFDQPASVALPEGAMSGMSAGLAPESDFRFPTGDAPSSAPSGASSVNGIPASALQAYQRAAAILNQADPACNIDWSLIAAIGRVESDHGRYGGNALDEQGRAQPGIYGIALDGSGGTARILDTDGGAYDNDAVYDRAVGPMQFIPGTWSVAGVDADQDGRKDPQDIDDAATASAVYLCAGSDDLSTDAGRRAAVYRYNHSDEYVELVLSIASTYSGGEYTAVPNGTPSSSTLVPQDVAGAPAERRERDNGQGTVRGPRNRPSEGARGGRSSEGTDPGGSVTDNRDGSPGGGSSSDGGSGGGSGNDGGSADGGANGGGNGGGAARPDPAPDPVGDVVDRARDTVDKVLPKPRPRPKPDQTPSPDPLAQARAYCRSQPLALSRCVEAYLSGGASAVEDLLGGLLP
jgi:membrane-bound lytic murein transglycosylase B